MTKVLTAEEITTHLEKCRLSANQAEKKLGMGQGTISKAISANSTRKLPEKWTKKFLSLKAAEKPKPAPQPAKKNPEPEKSITQNTMDILAGQPAQPGANENFERLQPHHAVPEWIEKIDDFCNENNCTPQDLVDFYKGKPAEKRPDSELTELLPDLPRKNETFFQKRQRQNQGS